MLRTACNFTLSAGIAGLLAGIIFLAVNDPTVPRPTGHGAGYALMQILKS